MLDIVLNLIFLKKTIVENHATRDKVQIILYYYPLFS